MSAFFVLVAGLISFPGMKSCRLVLRKSKSCLDSGVWSLLLGFISSEIGKLWSQLKIGSSFFFGVSKFSVLVVWLILVVWDSSVFLAFPLLIVCWFVLVLEIRIFVSVTVVVVVVGVGFVLVCWVWVLFRGLVSLAVTRVEDSSCSARACKASSLIEELVCVVDLGDEVGVVVGLSVVLSCWRVCLKVAVRFFLVLSRFLAPSDDVVAIEELLEVAGVVAIVQLWWIASPCSNFASFER